MLNTPKVLDEKIVYQNQRLKVKRLKLQFGNSQPVDWEFPDVADGVCAVPLLPNKNVILVKEWRPAWKQPILQIPAGKCGSDKEADRIAQIHRELQEEIGYDAKTVKKLINFGAFAGIHHSSHVYLATDLFPSTLEKLAEDIHEHVEITTMPLDDALNLFLSGREFTTSYTLVGLLLAQYELKIS